MQKPKDSLLFLVEVGDDGFCVVVRARSENVYIIVTAHISEKLLTIRADIELELAPLAGKLNISFVVGEY
jgi:hypothetical protein